MRKILFILLLGSLILVLGCTQQDGKVSGPFVGGTNGLEIGFVDSEPPERVFDNNEEDFDISIKVENVGEFDIPSGKIISTLSGIDPDSFSIPNPHMTLNTALNGKEEFNGNIIEGDVDEIVYTNAIYKHDLAADFETNVRADICYLYQTRATTSVCLKNEATDKDLDDPCQIDNENIVIHNSGAPLQISNVGTRSSGTNKVQLTFEIINEASGVVYTPDTFSNKCVVGDREEDMENRLKVTVITGSRRHAVECSILGGKSQGETELNENIRPVRCDISTNNAPENAIEEPVNIILDYFYRNAIQTSLIIENSEE